MLTELQDKKHSLGSDETFISKKPKVEPTPAGPLFPKNKGRKHNMAHVDELADKYLPKFNPTPFFQSKNDGTVEFCITGTECAKVFAKLQGQGVAIEYDKVSLLAAKLAGATKIKGIPLFYPNQDENIAREDFDRLYAVVNDVPSLNGLLKQGLFALFNQSSDNDPFSPTASTNKFQCFYIPNSPALRVGMKASDFFARTERLNVGMLQRKSPLAYWREDNFRFQLFKKIVEDALDSDIPICSRKVLEKTCTYAGYSCQFRPLALPLQIELLLKLYPTLPQHNWRILDLCGGWCDRLTGALADKRISHCVYVETNEKLIPLARRVNEAYNKHATKVHFLNKPAETLQKSDFQGDGFNPDMKFSMMFTSPPYYDIHDYHGTQTSTRYKIKNNLKESIRAWLQKFMYPFLDRADEFLEPGGFIAINIDDVRDRLGEALLSF